MLIKIQCIIIVILLLNCTSCSPSPNELKQKEAVKQLSSENWESRKKGVFALSHIGTEERKIDRETQKKLVDVIEMEAQMYENYERKLRKEGKSIDKVSDEMYKEFPPQTYGDYIKALAFFTASNNVEDGFPAIFKLIVDTDYNISPAILTLYGSKYVDFLIDKAMNGSIEEKKVAINALSTWVDQSGESDDFDVEDRPLLNQTERKKILPVFLKASQDTDYGIRFCSLFGLEEFVSDPDVRSRLKKMADNDNEQFIRQKAIDIFKNKK